MGWAGWAGLGWVGGWAGRMGWGVIVPMHTEEGVEAAQYLPA